jgi:hypothetical protein
MTKIETAEEFKKIKELDFGFIVIFDYVSNIIHQSGCADLSRYDFSAQNNSSLHWFSSIMLAEKSFNIIPCQICKPE